MSVMCIFFKILIKLFINSNKLFITIIFNYLSQINVFSYLNVNISYYTKLLTCYINTIIQFINSNLQKGVKWGISDYQL